MNEMADDVEGTPGSVALRGRDPPLGEIREQGAEHRGGTLENRQRLIEREPGVQWESPAR
jgi:hypothetical protein